MSYPAWPDLTAAEWQSAARHLIAKAETFDESKHPRHPGGSEEGGRFAESGRTGAVASTPELAAQAKDGIAAIEKLIPQAVDQADFSGLPSTWERVPEVTKEKAFKQYESVRYPSALRALRGGYLHEARDIVYNEQGKEVEAESVRRLAESLPQEMNVDPATLTVGKNVVGIWIPFKVTAKAKDGTELDVPQQNRLSQLLYERYQQVMEEKTSALFSTLEFQTRLAKEADATVKREWEELSPTDKFEQAKSIDPKLEDSVRKSGPQEWVTGVEQGSIADEDYARTRAVALRLTELRTDELRKERASTINKPTYTVGPAGNHTENNPLYIGQNEQGRVIASSNTLEQATANAEQWAQDEMNKALNTPTPELVHRVWQEWKRSSSSPIGLALQLAAARELGGVHRLTPNEINEAEWAAGEEVGGMGTLQAYVRAQWEVTQTIMAKAGEDKVQVYRGLMLAGERVNATKNRAITPQGEEAVVTNIKPRPAREWNVSTTPPAVEFDFNGQHFIIEKQKVAPMWKSLSPEQQTAVKEAWYEKDLSSATAAPSPARKAKIMAGFDALGETSKDRYVEDYGKHLLPYESDEAAVQRRMVHYLDHGSDVNLLVQLPELPLRRGGAVSTTGTLGVANEWAGVGNLPVDPVRVVLRLETPSTSVLSLPVYGVNIHGEHESVIIGTKDRWLWDAWRNKAPEFRSQPVADTTTKKAETKPLVIDLQDEDRGKPHWLSGLGQSIAKPPTPPAPKK